LNLIDFLYKSIFFNSRKGSRTKNSRGFSSKPQKFLGEVYGVVRPTMVLISEVPPSAKQKMPFQPTANQAA
jgi:hypothetical protein